MQTALQLVNENDTLLTVKLTFDKPLTEDVVVTLANFGNTNVGIQGYTNEEDSNAFTNMANYELKTGTLSAASVTVLADPTATEEPTPTATATPEPTETPYTTSRPTQRPIETPDVTEPVETKEPITNGIVLEYDKAASTSQSAVINIKSAGLHSVYSWQAVLSPSAGTLTAEGINSIQWTSPLTASNVFDEANNAYILGGYMQTALQLVNENDTLLTVKLTFDKPLTEDVVVTLANFGNTNVGIQGYTNEEDSNAFTNMVNYELKTGTLPAATVTILANPTATEEPSPTATATPEPFTGGEIALGDLISADTPAEDETLGKLVSVVVTVTTSDDKEAVYGEDYVAKYKNEELTEDEYFNLINGYGDAIKDALKEIVFVVDDGVTVNAAPAYQTAEQETSGEITVVPGLGGEDTYTKPSPTATATAKPTPTATATNRPNNGNGSGNNNNNSNDNNGNGSGQIARPGTTVNTGTGVTSVNFTDLDSVAWARDAINALARSGLINGRSETIFDPNASVTRAEFTKMVCSAFGVASTPNAAQKFTDVAPSDWYYGWVQAAASYGIVTGVSDTAFDPNATIKRQDMATIMYRAIQSFNMTSSLPAGTPKTFADYDQIDDYAKASVTALSSASVINGTSATTFEPYATATRAQAACIIYQYYKAIGAM